MTDDSEYIDNWKHISEVLPAGLQLLLNQKEGAE